jgi:hypothetical protein
MRRCRAATLVRRTSGDAGVPTTLTAEHRRALGMLAEAGQRGCTAVIMAAHFEVELLAGLLREGWAGVHIQTVGTGRRPTKVLTMKITDAGRQALKRASH